MLNTIQVGGEMVRKSAGGTIKCTSSNVDVSVLLFDEVVRLRAYLSHIESKNDEPFIFVDESKIPIYIKRDKDMWYAMTNQSPYFCIQGADRNSVLDEVRDVLKVYKRHKEETSRLQSL